MATGTPSSSSATTTTTTATSSVVLSSSSSAATSIAAVSLPPPPPPPPSSSNKEKTNHTRICRLLVVIGRQVLQDVFDNIHPPSTLNAVLWSTSNQTVLKKLKTKKILFEKQWDTLFPTSRAVTSADFDITLLFLLLRNICKLKAPGTGWDKPPLPSDLSKEADLLRIKRCRNELYAHIVNAAIPDNEFQTLWDDIEAALVRVSGSKYQEQICRFKAETIDPECELHFKVIIQSWEEGEDKTVDAIRGLNDTVTEGKKETVDAMRELKETFDKMIMAVVMQTHAVSEGEEKTVHAIQESDDKSSICE